MANTAAATIERTNQENYIIALLKRNPGKKISGETLCENLGISHQKKRTIIDGLKPKYPQLHVRRGGKGGVYYWEGSDDIPALENKEPENPNVNSEGYSDPTAGTAINTVDKEIEKMSAFPKFGDIMRARHSTGETPLFFVLWSTETHATGIYILEDDGTTIVKSKSTISLKLDGKSYIMATTDVCSKPVKYLIEKAFTAGPATMVQVKHRVAANLNIQPKVVEKEKIVEKPVEKIVYKDRTVYKEKPVEKIVYKDRPEVPEGYISKADAVISDLLHQLDIYKDMVNRLAPLK